jgi:hypothetical protein
MAKLLPHLSQELENALIRATELANDGYPHELHNIFHTHDAITDDDIATIQDELAVAKLDGRSDLDYDAHIAEQMEMHNEQLDTEESERAERYAVGEG